MDKPKKTILSIFLLMLAGFLLIGKNFDLHAQDNQQNSLGGIVSVGKRIVLRDGELSLELPKGWIYHADIPGQTLLALAPEADNLGFQRAIQIITFGGPKFLDEVTANEYREIIARKFSGASAAITNYQMNNHLKIEMADGRPALLFYAGFKKDKREFMQAHLLISNMERHFVISYTDGAEHFANDAPTPNLNEAWQVLISTVIRGSTPLRYGSFYKMGGLVAFFCMSIALWTIYRKNLAQRYEREIKSEFAEDLATGKKKLQEVSGPEASLHSNIEDDEVSGSDPYVSQESHQSELAKKVKKKSS